MDQTAAQIEDVQHHTQKLQDDFDALTKRFEALSSDYYLNNFPTSQDFQKYSRFNTRLKIPHYASNPTVGNVGDIIEVGGKAKICTVASSTAPTWTTIGTQS